jgi:hypothetical protein
MFGHGPFICLACGGELPEPYDGRHRFDASNAGS